MQHEFCNSSDSLQVSSLCSLEKSQYVELETGKPGDEPPQCTQHTSAQSKSIKWDGLCTLFNFGAAIKEHPIAFAIIVVTFVVLAVAIGVGFGVDWQGSASSSEGPCICEEGKMSIFVV